MTLFEAILKRKSTRAYSNSPLPEETIKEILELSKNTVKLFPSEAYRVEVDSNGKAKGLFVAKAPDYLAFISGETEEALMNAGFVLQQVSLHLTTLGLGSCWLGGAKPTGQGYEGEPPLIMMALGYPEGDYLRDPDGFKRKTLAEISQGSDPRIEYARLAPSATNSQPWYFVSENGFIHLYRKRLGVLKVKVLGRMNQIDMGIALCHLYLASEHLGMPFAYKKLQAADVPPVDGFNYVGSVG